MNTEKQKTILLVEDEVIIAMSEKMILEKFGYRVLAVHHGEDAVTTVANTPAIDLILMDIDLGAGMDGTEAAALILKERDLPVVFLSSHMEPEVVAKTEKITSYGYVVKNSSGTVLDASIKMAFKLFVAKISEKRKENALRQSEEILRYIVKHDPNAIAVYDRDLHYIAVSDRYLQDYNVREADIIGRHHYDVFPEMPQRWKDVHRRCLAGAIERNDDDSFERPDGSLTYNRWECRPWRRVDGEIGGIITYTEVTTGRKLAELKLAQNLDLLTKLARLVPGVIYQYRLDPDGRSAFPYASPGMNDIYEVTPEEVRDDATAIFARLHPDDYDRVAGAIQASALTLNTFHCEFRVLLPRQGLRWRWSQAHPERLTDGGILWHGIISDITERKLAEEALRESEAQFRTLTTLAPIGIYLTDVRGQCRYANPRWCEMTGLTQEEALGNGWTRGLHPEDREAVFAAWQKTVESEGRWGLEYRFQTPDGKVTWVHGLAAPQRDATGRISGYVGANVDISARKRAEEALIVSEARSRALLRTIPDMLFRVNHECVFLDYQAETKSLYAQNEPTLIGKRCRDVLPPEFVELIEAKIRAALESGALQTFEYQLPVPGLGVRSYEARMAASGTDEVTAIIRDITESHQAQRALRETEERWRDILFSMADWVWEVDTNGAYTYSSEKGERFLGYSRREIIGKTPFDFMPPEEAVRVGPIFGEILSRKGIVKDLENWNIDKNGKRICLLTNGVPILDEQGNLLGYRGVDKDITERKQAEDRIKNALSFQQALLDAVPSPIFYKDANFAYLGGNKAFERYIGLTREQFIGKTVYDIAPADLAERYDRADRELLKQPGVQTYEGVVAYADGTRHNVIFNKAIFTDAEGRPAGMIGVILDITERKLAEATLQENNSRLELAMQAADMAWWEMDLPSGHVSFAKRKAEMLGYPAEKFKHYQDFVALIHPDDREKALAAMRGHLNGLLPRYEVDYRIAASSGGYVWFHDIGSVGKRDANNKPLNVTGLVINISERKRAEQALQKSINDFRGYFNMGTVGVSVTSPTKGWIEVNDRLCSMLGYSREELLGKNWIDLTHPDDVDADLELFAEVLAGRRDAYELEKRFVRKDGRIIHTKLYATCQRNPDKTVHHFLASLVDITEQKRAEQALLESKERYEGFIVQSSDGVYRLEMDTPMPLDLPLEEQIDYMYHHLRIAECNPAFLAMYGMRDVADILGKSLLDMHGGTDNPVNRQTSRQFIVAGYRIQQAVTEEVDTRGNRKHFSNNSLGILENGRLMRMWGTQTDISDRVQMEAERRVLQEIVQGVLASSNLREFLAIVHASVAKIVPAENFFVALFNKESEMFEEAYMADKYDPSFPPSRLEKSLSRHVFLSGRPLLLTNQGQFAALEATGQVELVGTRSPSWLGVPLIAGGETIGVMVLQDYEQENRYRQQDLEFFVSIAGQVAMALDHQRAEAEIKRQLAEKEVLLKEVHHRIKNNFASIGGLLSLHKQTSSNPEAVAALQDAIGRIDSMRLLYEKLLLGGDFQDASAKNYIESLAASVVSLFPDLAKVKLNLDVDDFKLDPKRLFPLGIIINELLTNIMKYAFAGKKSGTIKLVLAKTGNRVTFTLQDNGNGLPQGFDLKESKGFGLMLVKMLSQQLEGSFSIETHKGTRCRMVFEI